MRPCGCLISDIDGLIVDECLAHHTLRHDYLDAKNRIIKLEEQLKSHITRKYDAL